MTAEKKLCAAIAVSATLIVLAFSCQAESITIQQYLNAVRREVVGDSGLANDPLTRNMITEWVNGGRHLAAAISGGLQKDTIIVTVEGQVSYLLPSDFLKLKGVITPPAQTASDLSVAISAARSRGPEEIGNMPTGVGSADEWIQWGTDTAKLYINPIPQGVYNIHLFYVAKPLDLDSVSVTTCDLPRAYQEAVIQYASARAYNKMGEHEKAAAAMGLFNTWIQALMQTLSDRRTEIPGEK